MTRRLLSTSTAPTQRAPGEQAQDGNGRQGRRGQAGPAAQAGTEPAPDGRAGVRVLTGPGEALRHPNPYIRTLLRRLDEVVELEHFRWRHALLGRYDVIHLHWPEHLVASRRPLRRLAKTALLALVIVRAKLTRTKLVWTVHNDTPHEAPSVITGLAFSLWQRSVDATIFLTEAGRATYDPRRRTPVNTVIRHGHYGPSIPEGDGASGPPGPTPYLVAFGLLRRYKGLDRLIEVARSAEERFDLVIAGPPADERYVRELRTLASTSPTVRLDARYVPQPELVALIRGSAGVVLPYLKMNNSGALLLALTLGKPVLVPDSPSNREIAEHVGPGWIHPFQGQLLAEHLEKLLAMSASPPRAAPDLRAFEWDEVISAHEHLYRRLAKGSRQDWLRASRRVGGGARKDDDEGRAGPPGEEKDAASAVIRPARRPSSAGGSPM